MGNHVGHTPKDKDAEIEKLQKENATLLIKIDNLNRHLTALRTRLKSVTGNEGEDLLAGLLIGDLTVGNKSFDFIGNDGLKYEIKTSKLGVPMIGANTKRWTWSKIFGMSRKKEFDWIVLVGEKDERFADHYTDKESDVVCFIISYETAIELIDKNNTIQLTSNPNTASKSKSSVLFTNGQMSRKEILDKFS
ncbi:hypothetical protein [Methylobacterium sp. CM6247]